MGPDRPVYSETEIRLMADRIFFRAGDLVDPATGTAVYVLNSTALPDPKLVEYSRLLTAVLDTTSRTEDYAIVLFAGGAQHRPSWSWMIHTYSVLDRDLRKRLKRLYIVHESWWVRTLLQMVAGVVSSKFRRKVVHVADLTALAAHMPLGELPIPLDVHVHDRRVDPTPPAPPVAPVFGADLPGGVLPAFWADAVALLARDGIYTEGVFRVPPKQEHFEIVREALDRGQRLDLAEAGPYVAASVLKLYLRLLPTPPIPRSVMAAFPDYVPSPAAAAAVAQTLPAQSLTILASLVPLLQVITAHERRNRMSASNLAKSITPSLVR
ncbi:divergent CRAL/TRIO domain-containing protein, partial [Dipodascopsis tothii]|uniref:divergent CRAL/TRIO domain-containing protein n=1 Tax=Dipodascopsis tothii TaxID=44089 RepID=UPI0034CDE08F